MQFADMHCDTVSKLFSLETEEKEASLYQNSCHLDLQRMKKAGYLLQNFALFVDREEFPDLTAQGFTLLSLYEREMEKNKELIRSVFCYEDIWKNQRAGRMSSLLTLEEGGILQGSSKLLQEFYARGVRLVTLTWNYPNEIGYPHKDTNPAHGLTTRGRELVEEMEELGILIDVSHLSDAGFYDVAECTSKPFVASHSNARAVCNASRNLTDDMIRILGERGGVTGLNFYPDFLTLPIAGQENPGTIAAVAAHAKHIVNVGGIEVLGLGSDFDGIDGHKELPGVQAVVLLLDAFAKEGFTESEIDKILCENVLRVYKEVL